MLPKSRSVIPTVAIIITAILMIVCLVMNIVIRAALYQESLNFIINYQQPPNTSLKIFYNIISILVNTIYVCILFGLLYVTFPRKITVMVFLSYFLINTFIMMLMKGSFQEPRPFWYSQQIEELEWGCPSEFGNPSGHSWLVAVIYEPIITDFTGSGYWSLAFLLPIIADVLVPVSRMYLGAHSGNQVMMGLTLGLGMCLLYRYVFCRLLYKLYNALIAPRVNWILLGIIAIVNLLCFAAPIIIFAVMSKFHPVDQQYVDMLNAKCGKSYSGLDLQGNQFTTGAIIQIMFGMLFGAAWAGPHGFHYFYGLYSFKGDDKCRKTGSFFLKLLMEFLLILLPIGLLTILANLLINNYYAKYVLSGLGMWLATFFLIGLSPRILQRCGIVRYFQPTPLGSGKTKEEIQMAQIGYY